MVGSSAGYRVPSRDATVFGGRGLMAKLFIAARSISSSRIGGDCWCSRRWLSFWWAACAEFSWRIVSNLACLG
jgi:hypothetical protein